MGRFVLRRVPWWKEDGVSRFVAGVFEGGGAKGILYRGALEAMVEDRDRPTWFAAVAGASAGAITAMLIAAGLRPDQVAAETAEGLQALRQPRLLNGVLRMREGVSYLDQESLLSWLRDVLELHVGELTGAPGGGTVTFGELFGLTSVELDVVAVDLARRRPVVFNHLLTPACGVADAVVASAAIPLAFESQTLLIPGMEPQSTPTTGLIVDGGVISNFPMWVFTDRSFREWAGLEQLSIAIPVVGFLLDEPGDPDAATPDLYADSIFFPDPARFRTLGGFRSALERGSPTPDELKSWKFRPRPERPPKQQTTRRSWAGLLALAPWALSKVLLSWIPLLLRRNAGGDRGRWPTPKNRWVALLVDWYDALMTGVRPPGVFLAGFVVTSLTIFVGAYYAAWRPLARLIQDIIDGSAATSDAWLLLLLVPASLLPVYAWMLLTMLFTSGWIFHRTIQQSGYGLLRTFLQNPAAPPWAGKAPDDIVVRLPVPQDSLTTLHDNLSEQARAVALEDARAATRTMLHDLDARQGVDPNTDANNS